MPEPLFSGRVVVVTDAGQRAGRAKTWESTQHEARDHHGMFADPHTENVGPS
jgi:hypothetical protein